MVVPTHPSRAQFERLTVSGQQPTVGQPGSFAVNVVDGLLWTFDPAGIPIRLDGMFGFHSEARTYLPGAGVIVGDTLYVALSPVAPGPFDPADWMAVLGSDASGRPAPAATGLIEGGNILLVSGSTVSVAAGRGIVVSAENPAAPARTQVAWVDQTLSLPGGSDPARFAVVTSAGAITTASLTDPAVARRTYIVLGVLFYSGSGDITAIANVPQVTDQTAADVVDLRSALGGAFKTSGGRITPLSGNRLRVDAMIAHAAGASWRAQPGNPNTLVFPAENPATFAVVDRNGNAVSASTSVVPTNALDGGSGLVPVSPGFATTHFLFLRLSAPVSIVLQIGQVAHPSLGEAQRRVLQDWRSFVRAYPQSDAVVLVGAVTVAANATDLTSVTQARVAEVLPGPATTPQFQYQALDDAFLPRDGSAGMIGTLDMGGFAIQNALWDEGVF